MSFRLAWMAVAGAVAMLWIVTTSTGRAQLPVSQTVPEQAFSSSVGAVSASVIAAWRARGADNGEDVRVEVVPAPPLGGARSFGGRAVRPPDGTLSPTRTMFERYWTLDLLVLWRWKDRAPEITDGGGGDSGPGIRFVPYRIVVEGGRELRVEHDIEADTVRLDGTTQVVELAGANVIMLDVGEQEVTVSGMATIDRFAVPDAVEAAKVASADVAAFVGSW